jgi:hypothetical protein
VSSLAVDGTKGNVKKRKIRDDKWGIHISEGKETVEKRIKKKRKCQTTLITTECVTIEGQEQ